MSGRHVERLPLRVGAFQGEAHMGAAYVIGADEPLFGCNPGCDHGGNGRHVRAVDYAPALDAAAATAVAAFRQRLDEHTALGDDADALLDEHAAPRDGAPLSFVLLDETSEWDRMRARSSSAAGLASLRDPWANDPDRTTRREAWS